MKRIISFLIGIVLLCSSIRVQADDVKLYAKAAVLMDAESGKNIIWKIREKEDGKCQHNENPDLSCTLSSTVTWKKRRKFLRMRRLSLRSVWESEKEKKYKVKDLLYGLMLESYNDCAVVLGRTCRGIHREICRKNQSGSQKGRCQKHSFCHTQRTGCIG